MPYPLVFRGTGQFLSLFSLRSGRLRCPRMTSIDCLVPKGGILAMRPLIVHASSKSRSDVARRVLHIEYASSRFTEDGLELAVA